MPRDADEPPPAGSLWAQFGKAPGCRDPRAAVPQDRSETPPGAFGDTPGDTGVAPSSAPGRYRRTRLSSQWS